MATTFYFTQAQSDLYTAASPLEYWMKRETRGSGATTCVTNVPTGSGYQYAACTASAGGTLLVWYSKPLNAVTISGSVTRNLCGYESGMNANAHPSVYIDRCDNTGGYISTIISGGWINEWTTSETAKNVSTNPTSTALSTGDRLRFTLYVMSYLADAGYTQTYVYGGAAGATGDSYITFTESITEYTATSAIKVISGVPIAGVKKVSGVPIASVKKVSGVSNV